MKSGIVLLLTPALLLAAAAVPAALSIDPAKSTVVATFRQLNVPVDGGFTKLSGTISFDPAKPEASMASIEIDTASYDMGLEDYNAEVRKKEWFDSKTYPKASFVSSSFKSLGADRFQASGKLSLKGKVVAVSVPVSVKPEAATTVFEGTLPVSRKVFSIGDPAWNETVDDAVMVKFRIVQPK